MIKVKIEKQTKNGIESISDTELQEKPAIGETLEISDKLYTVKAIRQSSDRFIITVKDKHNGVFTGLQHL